MTRVRADALLVARKLVGSRTEAQALIMAGKVTSGPRRIDKPGTLLPEDAEVHVASAPGSSRAAATSSSTRSRPSPRTASTSPGRRAVDVGASTGGFTDCLLQRGAARVFAVDVGYGQLAAKLRADARVEVRDRVNARELAAERTSTSPSDLVVVDASFISISRLIDAIARLLRPGGISWR